jgi:hypothetical protein
MRGYGDGADKPTKPIELIEDAEEAAEEYLAREPIVRERMERVAKLIEGFEDSYGLELLSSMHWVMCHVPEASTSLETAVASVQNWNSGKRHRLKRDHLRKAWQRLKESNWDTEARSVVH